MKRARISKHPWLVACDADMSPEDFEKSLWLRKTRCMWQHRRKLPRAGQKSAKGEWIEKISDCVIVCNSLKGKISHMQVVEDFESRPHKAVSFVVEREKMQE